MIVVCMHCHWFLTNGERDVPADMEELRRLEVEVSHGLCKPCEEKHYPEEEETHG